MIYKDLREFIEQGEVLGALRHVDNADAHFELGGITEVAAALSECPALLFDQIKGYARGFRVFTNATTNPQRAALALGIDPKLRPLDALRAWKEKRQSITPHPPVSVTAAIRSSRSASASCESRPTNGRASPPSSLATSGGAALST